MDENGPEHDSKNPALEDGPDPDEADGKPMGGDDDLTAPVSCTRPRPRPPHRFRYDTFGDYRQLDVLALADLAQRVECLVRAPDRLRRIPMA